MIPETDIAPVNTEIERRLRFGSVAEQYDRARPGYPEDLLDIVLDYGALLPGDRVLDVGAGTGQAAMQFAERGLSVLSMDPSAEMTEIANRKFAQSGLDARAVTSDFESAALDAERFNLVCAACSWHWLDPADRARLAAQATAPGGTLAVMWTWPQWRRTDLRPALDEVYRVSGAPVADMAPMYPHDLDFGVVVAEWVKEIQERGEFVDHQGKLCSWAATYTAAAYTELLGTYSDHLDLEPAVRNRLFDGIERVIDRAGGTIELEYSTLLLLARLQ